MRCSLTIIDENENNKCVLLMPGWFPCNIVQEMSVSEWITVLWVSRPLINLRNHNSWGTFLPYLLSTFCYTLLYKDCKSFRVGNSCCEFICLDDTILNRDGGHDLNADLGLRLIASAITAILSLSLLFFLIHRLRQRKIRGGLKLYSPLPMHGAWLMESSLYKERLWFCTISGSGYL